MKAMIVPGNGNTGINENWYPHVKEELESLGIEVIAENMPDADLARREFWLPFIESKLKENEDVILIGHSSGAVAIMRYLENHKARGAVLVGASYSDLGDKHEKASGYFDDVWKWRNIRDNADWIVIFASADDPYVPIEQPRYIQRILGAEYHEYNDKGHFGIDVNRKEFQEIIDVIKDKLSERI